MTTLRVLMSAAILAVTFVTVQAGGWAIVTVEELPERIVAAENVPLRFSVRQHGQRLVAGLQPEIEFTFGARSGRVAAEPMDRTGYYTAVIRLPEPGLWRLTIHSGFGTSKLTLNPIEVVAAADPSRARSEDAKRGADLFVAKGCASCHYHAAAAVRSQVPVAGDLTAKRYPEAFLAKLLADPSVLQYRQWTMPNLDLKQPEIAALTAFINKE